MKKGVPNGPFSATKSLVYCFFPDLTTVLVSVPVRFPGHPVGPAKTYKMGLS